MKVPGSPATRAAGSAEIVTGWPARRAPGTIDDAAVWPAASVAVPCDLVGAGRAVGVRHVGPGRAAESGLRPSLARAPLVSVTSKETACPAVGCAGVAVMAMAVAASGAMGNRRVALADGSGHFGLGRTCRRPGRACRATPRAGSPPARGAGVGPPSCAPPGGSAADVDGDLPGGAVRRSLSRSGGANADEDPPDHDPHRGTLVSCRRSTRAPAQTLTAAGCCGGLGGRRRRRRPHRCG